MVDLTQIDLNLLVSLDRLLKEKNVTRAAEKLGVTQSTVSAQLSRLRKTFDDPLLIPSETGRGMVPTSRAEAIQPELKQIIQGVERLVLNQQTFNPHTDQRVFHIAASDNAIICVGLPLIDLLNDLGNPKIQIAFHPYHEHQIAPQMEAGDIDLLIGSERMLPQSMKARKLYDDRFVQLQRKGHPRGTGPLDLETYCDLKHLLVSISEGNFHGFMDEHLEKVGRTRQVVLSVQQFTLVSEILRSTDYVCSAPSRIADRYRDSLDVCELPFESQTFGLYLAWHPRNHADLGLNWIKALMMSVVESASAQGLGSGSGHD